ncbi:hypothetical protein NM688_g4026 [Phlebia brevispora]|uniref:Uncharacterized protein n=1 Tax=Phlebia brevispora TaxID=194682 RepID=A0ACC1T413_9APHY|nr:hypothetical protein NM688_g4026 [Phlebia brevispora]
MVTPPSALMFRVPSMRTEPQWTSTTAMAPNFCLDAGTTPGDGTQMKIWQCYSGLAAQTWYLTDDNRISLENQGLSQPSPASFNANGGLLQDNVSMIPAATSPTEPLRKSGHALTTTSTKSGPSREIPTWTRQIAAPRVPLSMLLHDLHERSQAPQVLNLSWDLVHAA